MTKEQIIETLMVIIMILGLIMITVYLLINKKYLGARVVQFSCIVLLIPAIIILGEDQIIKGETVGTLIGSLLGYVLSGISNYDNPKKSKGKQTSSKATP